MQRGKWRAKRFSIRLGRYRRLDISARRFKTSPQFRSRTKKQLVIPVNLFSVREAAFIIKKKHRTQAALRRPVFAPLLLTILGLSGTFTFASALEQPAQLTLINKSPAPVQTSQHSSPVVSHVLPKSRPVRLEIPKIAVDTTLVPVDLKADGTIGMPGPDVAGWYDKGPTPGEAGPSIIVGHVDRVGGIAVFWRLRELIPGDTFSVLRADGSTANFKVVDVEQFEQDKFPTRAVYGPITYAGIRLITCGGTFNTATGHYDHNTVIYGQLE
jgi:sortase (surface protein transpeptidase)